MIYMIILLFSILFGLLLRGTAVKREANQIFWFVMGFVFGLFALPFIVLVRREHDFEKAMTMR